MTSAGLITSARARKSKITYLFNTATVTYIVNDITVFKRTNKV